MSAARDPVVLNKGCFVIPSATVHTLPTGLLQRHIDWNSWCSDETAIVTAKYVSSIVLWARRHDRISRQFSPVSTDYQCDSELFFMTAVIVLEVPSLSGASIFTTALRSTSKIVQGYNLHRLLNSLPSSTDGTELYHYPCVTTICH